ncbi:MAG: 16S rRNA (cytosine(1402)-N(4))-methyltransferase RsmH [Alphaproteobacteria bacterium]
MIGAVNEGAHKSVMVPEVLSLLQPTDGELYIDGTAGRAGHTKEILKAADCEVICLDRDPQAIEEIAAMELDRVKILQTPFSRMDEAIEALGIKKVHGVLLDLGVSSPQLDQANRGFSFSKDGPLDMRMDPTSGKSAADVVNELGQDELANLIYDFGEERRSRAVARAIAKARELSPITRTMELADIVRSVVRNAPSVGIDPATRTFQALRIFVNDELGELDRGLEAALKVLAPGGRLVVISFHSLEDRRVKHFIKAKSGRGISVSRHLPQPDDLSRRTFLTPLTGRAIKASTEECKLNRRARSALLRGASRTELAS